MPMRNPFARPETTPQWLLGSLCWTVACLGGWRVLGQLLSSWPATEAYGVLFLPTGFVLAQWLLWRKAIQPGWGLLGYEAAAAAWWLRLPAYLWFSVLVLQQVACLVVLVVALVWTH